MNAINLRREESALWTHCEAKHNGDATQFKMKATGYFLDPPTRQIEEAVRICHTKNAINRKGEWKKTAVPRATYWRE